MAIRVLIRTNTEHFSVRIRSLLRSVKLAKLLFLAKFHYQPMDELLFLRATGIVPLVVDFGILLKWRNNFFVQISKLMANLKLLHIGSLECVVI